VENIVGSENDVLSSDCMNDNKNKMKTTSETQCISTTLTQNNSHRNVSCNGGGVIRTGPAIELASPATLRAIRRTEVKRRAEEEYVWKGRIKLIENLCMALDNIKNHDFAESNWKWRGLSRYPELMSHLLI
jgi:hypothetical protein